MRIAVLVVLLASFALGQSQMDGDPSFPPNDAGMVPTSGDVAGLTSSIPDPLNLGAAPSSGLDISTSNTLPPYTSLNADSTVSPNIVQGVQSMLHLDVDHRIKETEDLLNRMVWQLNRETAWANSVHDIIQNYQYKYTKVLSNIKKHTAAVQKMRELASSLKKARLHEVLVADLGKAGKELAELAASSSETANDEGSYPSLKERVDLLKQDLAKMSNTKVNKVLHGVQEQLKSAASEAVPPPSSDTLKSLVADPQQK